MLSSVSAPAVVERTPAATVLVVEDDPHMSRTLSKALKANGYTVVVASTGADALDVCAQVQPDLIILDLMLPDADGLTLTTSLRSRTSASIVICSARHGQIDRVLGSRLGAVDFLAKPFDLDDLEARVATALRRSQQPAEPPGDEIQVRRRGLRTRARLQLPTRSGDDRGTMSECRETGNGMVRQ